MPHQRIDINFRPCAPQSADPEQNCYTENIEDYLEKQKEYIGQPNFQFIYNTERFLIEEYDEKPIQKYSVVT